jgi:hypothetical protein
MSTVETKNPRYPLYIVSKGRHDTRLTSKALEMMCVPYHIIIEEQEYDQYAAVIDPKKIVILDKKYQRDYEVCDDLGDTKSKGSGAARNFAWQHSIDAGYTSHWVMDDNINGFFRLNKNLKVQVSDGTIFRCMEDFCDRYENIGMAGPNYCMFSPRKKAQPAFVLNTRIYSCNLIRNNMLYRWRGRYNEDTDLSLCILKDGMCTVLFNAFLQFKLPTQTVAGGNTTEIYGDGTKVKSEMIVDLHPDVARMAWRFGRWHHFVNYLPFKRNRLKRCDIKIGSGINNYGMSLVPFDKRSVASTK